MSILIKGMEMPKNCNECPFFRYWDEMASSCEVFNETKWVDDCNTKALRHKDCPLVEQKTGKWEMYNVNPAAISFKCSECGNRSILGIEQYCSNCGTKMENGTKFESSVFDKAEEVDFFEDLSWWQKLICDIKAWWFVLWHGGKE